MNAKEGQEFDQAGSELRRLKDELEWNDELDYDQRQSIRWQISHLHKRRQAILEHSQKTWQMDLGEYE